MSSSASSTSSISSQYSHRPLNGQVKKRTKSSLKSTVIGKTPVQVEKRNARERKRVQAVNHGYEVLAKQISDWEELKNKKLTKAETLKAAIMYIQHLEGLLTSPGHSHSMSTHSTPSPSSITQSRPLIKDEPQQPIEVEKPSFEHQNLHQIRQFHQIPTQNNCPSQNYSSPVYNSYFNGIHQMVPIQSNITPNLNCQLEYGNENHLLMHYDFNAGRYS